MTTNNKLIDLTQFNGELQALPEVSDDLLNEAFQFDSRRAPMTLEERLEQEVSFVWGNALESDRGTIEAVRKHLKLTAA